MQGRTYTSLRDVCAPLAGGADPKPKPHGGGGMKNSNDPLEIMSLFQRVMIVFLLMFAAIGVVAILSASS